MKSFIITVDGNIGSGKSTLVENIKRYINLNNIKQKIIFLQEPVDEWNNVKDRSGKTILEHFYKDQEKYAFQFQMMAYISRLALLRQTIKENPGSVIIVERSIFTDRHVFAKMLYDDKKISEIEYTIYLKWFDEFAKDITLDGMIYVKTSPQTAYDRVVKRSRTGESIPLEYLASCDKYHNDWISRVDKTPIHYIDGNIDTDTDKNITSKWIKVV